MASIFNVKNYTFILHDSNPYLKVYRKVNADRTYVLHREPNRAKGQHHVALDLHCMETSFDSK